MQGLSLAVEGIVMDKNMKDTTDQPVLRHIQRLVSEEHKLYNQGAVAEEDRSPLAKIHVELDQCWDLLRQRRARREFGHDPKRPQVRPPDAVQDYEV